MVGLAWDSESRIREERKLKLPQQQVLQVVEEQVKRKFFRATFAMCIYGVFQSGK